MSQAVRFILRTKLNILRRKRVYIVHPTLLLYLTIRSGRFEKRNKQTKKHRSFRVTIFFSSNSNAAKISLIYFL